MPPMTPAEKIRNVAILGHSHDGKTTLAEAMLFAAGAISRMGSTESGSSTLDFEPEEIRRRMSINLALAQFEVGDHKLNLLDAPGYLDFAGQAMAALRAADGAIIVVSPSSDQEVGTVTAWEQCNSALKPRILVVNKMDKENADYYGALATLRNSLYPKPVPLQIPIGSGSSFCGVVDLLHQRSHTRGPDGRAVEADPPADLREQVAEYRAQLMEGAAEAEDELLEKFLADLPLTDEELNRGLRAGILAGKVVPVVCCSATQMLGVRSLTRLICELMPAPAVDPSGPARAFCFNTSSDFVRVSYLRVESGGIKSDQHLTNLNRGVDERLGQLFFVKGKEHINTPSAGAGDLVAVSKLQVTQTGDTLGVSGEPLPGIALPEPVYRLAVAPRARGDEDKIFGGLARLAEEDPTLRIERNEETHQTLIGGLGDVHLDVVVEKLKRKFGVEAVTSLPAVAYKESITRMATAEGRHVKQSGGHGQYAVCTISIEPAPRGSHFIWEDRIFGGSIPQNYRPSVQKGILDTMSRGVVAGYPMVDIKVTLLDGKYHPVDSSDMAFQLAGSLALRKAAMEAGPIILEPIMEVEVRVPEWYLGAIMSDLNARRGRISGTDTDGIWQIVRGQVPESEMLKFALDLRSITQGRGSFTMRHDHYDQMPQHLAQVLIDAHQKAEH